MNVVADTTARSGACEAVGIYARDVRLSKDNVIFAVRAVMRRASESGDGAAAGAVRDGYREFGAKRQRVGAEQSSPARSRRQVLEAVAEDPSRVAAQRFCRPEGLRRTKKTAHRHDLKSCPDTSSPETDFFRSL